MRRTRWTSLAAGVSAVALLAATACRGDDQRTESVTPDVVRSARDTLDPALLAQLDSGNAAMRAREHASALEHYRRALEVDSASAPAWFGIYMAADALGREDEAAEALRRARGLEPGASLLDPDTVP